MFSKDFYFRVVKCRNCVVIGQKRYFFGHFDSEDNVFNDGHYLYNATAHSGRSLVTTWPIPSLHLTSSVSRWLQFLTASHVIVIMAAPLATTVNHCSAGEISSENDRQCYNISEQNIFKLKFSK